jgi:hypothetical protein
VSDISEDSQTSRSSRRGGLIILFFYAWYLVLGIGLELDKPEMRYLVTDFMVTYTGGFVRRGILGQTIVSIGDLLNLAPLHLIAGLRIILWAAFAAVLANMCFKRWDVLSPAGVALILANPLVGFYLWYEPGAFDLAFILLTVFHLWLSRQTRIPYVWAAATLFGPLALYVALCHEGFFFLCLPINGMITWRTLSPRRAWQFVAIYWAPLIGAMLTARFHGTAAQAEAIQDDWMRRGVKLPILNAAFFLPYDPATSMRRLWAETGATGILKSAIGAALCLTPLWLLARSALKPESETHKMLVQFLLIPALCTLPIFPFADDWHRWLSVTVVSGLLCVALSVPPASLTQVRMPKWTWAALMLTSFIVRPMASYTEALALVGGSVPTSGLVIEHRIHRAPTN